MGYPLTQAQAYAYVEAGIAVAGHVAGGYEVLVLQTTETTYEDQPVQEQVCEPEYDAYQEKYVTKCRYKTRYERRPVTKKVYIVSGFGGRRQYRNTAGAMSDAITRGASAFRRV